MLFLWILILGNFAFSQNKEVENRIKTDKNSFYIVCRGTTTKISFITDFNLKDKNITHVGIGVIDNGKMKIYHVDNSDLGNGSLFVQQLFDFVSPFDIKYLSVWEYKSNEEQIEKLKSILNMYTKKRIEFDMEFDENGDSKFYCSEFCSKVLLTWKPIFNFKKVNKKLDLIYSNTLKRDSVLYYPVDFFQVDNKFVKIFEKFY